MEEAPPAVRRELLALLRATRGDADDCVTRALGLLAEELGMQVAFVSAFRDGQRLITHSAASSFTALPVLAGREDPLEETLCHLVAVGGIETIVPDASTHPVLRDHPLTQGFGIGSYVGVPLQTAGGVVGALCCASDGPRDNLGPRDIVTLHTVATYVGEVLGAALGGPPVPAPGDPAHDHHRDMSSRANRRSDVDLPALAAAVADGASVESLARPLLALLHKVTALESTYLTLVDWEGDEQEILYSVNTSADMQMPEGLKVPWADTLCRRSLDEGRRYTANVPETWGDSQAAKDLGIVTYVSIPVTDPDNGVVGTLCGVSSEARDIRPDDLQAMEMFARLVGDQMTRERAHAAQRARTSDLEARTRELSQLAVHDPLTGLLNRAGIVRWLTEVLPSVKLELEQLALAFIDVDSFKQVNDSLGHAAGDEVLREMARKLGGVGRGGDLRGRLGGDEFVVAAVLPGTAAAYGGWLQRLRRAAVVDLESGPVSASVGAVSITDPTLAVDDVLGLADGAMYRVKRDGRPAPGVTVGA